MPPVNDVFELTCSSTGINDASAMMAALMSCTNATEALNSSTATLGEVIIDVGVDGVPGPSRECEPVLGGGAVENAIDGCVEGKG